MSPAAAEIYEAIVKGENPPEPGIPESFNVLVKELQSLGLDVELGSRSEVQYRVGDGIDCRELRQIPESSSGRSHAVENRATADEADRISTRSRSSSPRPK